ncbi:MAG: hypothetical protein AABX53_02705 [Nanoarchaeota archaeon]
MITFFDNLERFKSKLKQLKAEFDVDALNKLDFPFFDRQRRYAVLSVPLYTNTLGRAIIVISQKNCAVFSDSFFSAHSKELQSIQKKPYGESTLLTFAFFKTVIKNYSHEFERIRGLMNELDLQPHLDGIEISGRDLRRLTDRFEELVQLMLVLKEKDIREFDTELLGSNYELLSAEARYWLERCRSHIYRVASLRTKSEMQSNRELNATMGRLTLIMTFLTITSIVVSVPGTIGAIFGIPALSDAFFKPHTTLLVWILMGSTALSILLGYVYWLSLGLRQKKGF